MTSSSRSGWQPKDMRTWIAELEAAGELIQIDKPVDPLTQMGSLLYQPREKALFFENLQNGSGMEGCVFRKIPMSATIFRRLKDVGAGNAGQSGTQAGGFRRGGVYAPGSRPPGSRLRPHSAALGEGPARTQLLADSPA